MKKLYLSETDKKVCGVCGGIGEYFGVDSTLIRLLVIILMIPMFPGVLIGYFIAAIVIPKKPDK